MCLYRRLAARLSRVKQSPPVYLCMETAAINEKVLGRTPPLPGALGASLAGVLA
jgi:hypothetical protein